MVYKTMGNTDLKLHMNQGEAERLRSHVLDYENAVRLSRQAQALADPNRVTLLALLGEAGKEICVSDLCLLTDREQSGVSRNLRILWEAGLVERTRWRYLVEYKPTSDGERLLTALLASSD